MLADAERGAFIHVYIERKSLVELGGSAQDAMVEIRRKSRQAGQDLAVEAMHGRKKLAISVVFVGRFDVFLALCQRERFRNDTGLEAITLSI